jgi:hypothetical protein
MNALDRVCRTIRLWIKEACVLPWSLADAVRQRRQKAVLDANEAERLDRIRNPAKYLGK